MIDAFARIRDDPTIGCVLLTGAGDKAFCSGGDQRYKDRGGYVGGDGLARLNVLDLQRQIRSLPIPVIALVNGYAIGGGQVLQVVCDLAIAATTRSSARSGRRSAASTRASGSACWRAWSATGRPRRSGSCAAATTPRRRSRWASSTTSCRWPSSRPRASQWANEILAMSPTAIRFLKSAFLVATDGLAGMQEFAGNATGLYYMTDEAHEGSTAFLEKRKPDFSRFPRRP